MYFKSTEYSVNKEKGVFLFRYLNTEAENRMVMSGVGGRGK